MSTLLPFIVAGLATGSVYSLAAMGLVVTYKTSGVFNFGHGAIGTIAAYAFYELEVQHGLPWPVAAVASVVVVGLVAGFLLERLARRLAQVELALKVVATVGLFVAVQGLAVARYGSATRDVPRYLPSSRYDIVGVSVGADQLIFFVVAVVAAVGLSLFFRRARLGVAMRGVVDDPDLLALSATEPVRVRRWAWTIGSAFAATSGVLLVPTLGLDASILTLLVVQAFGAAAIGAFSSIPLTYAGGLLIGVGAALATKYTAALPVLAGLPPSFPFIVLFVVLLVLPTGRLTEAASRPRRPLRPEAALPGRLRVAGYGLLAAVLLLVPQLVGSKLPVWINGLIFVVLFLSLNLLVRTSGQVSICHAAFAAVGATTFSHLTTGVGLPWLVALLLAGLVAVPVGAVVAVPAIRLSGVYLAVATFGFGILLERLVYPMAIMFGTIGNRAAPRPNGLGVDLTSDKAFYYVVLAVVAASCALVLVINRSRLGRLLRALAGSPVALETYGTNVDLTRVLAFCISSFMAGIAGALFAAFSGQFSGVGFNSFVSLQLLTVLVLAGRFEIVSAFVGGLVLAVVPTYLDNPTLVAYLPVLFGVAAIAIAATGSGDHSQVARLAQRSSWRMERSPVRARVEGSVEAPAAGAVA